ncbi:MAG: alpha/beta fold hydrolase [Actinomycetes bacterium]|jgi:2-hydroxy-6-oxo-octa-2,4-dienoate hydrolase
MKQRPEIGRTIVAHGIFTNYLDAGDGVPVVLVHGSGPGVSAYSNWRLTIPALAEHYRVFALDMVGFGFTERPDEVEYSMTTWVNQLIGFLDAHGLERAHLVGNSFGGGVALRTAALHPERVHDLVLMGSVGAPFTLTHGLDAIWGYEPSVAAMRRLLDIFAFNKNIAMDELAELRYRASIEPGVQEAFSAMFPAPRQQWVDAMVTSDELLRTLPHRTLIVHGREDDVIPVACSHHLFSTIQNAQLHVFGHCGHWTQIEYAQEFNGLLANFLSRTNS